jgi:hypothetical protein
MESASKRLRKKKEFSGLHPSLRVKVKKLTVFLTPPPFLPFSHGDYPPISSDAHAGPWTLQPEFTYTKIFARNYF